MAKALDEYNSKRNFSATPEPAGSPARKRKKAAEAQALQFCIQKHDASHLHYDFRLELDGTLKSWAVPKGPSLDPKVKRLAVHVEDHPISYASFEGQIPEGHYGAGEVIVWDRGVWSPIGDPQASLEKGRLKFELQGEKLAGVWNLVRTHMPGKREQWFLIKSGDEAARAEKDYDVLVEQPDSVLSERTLIPRQRGAKGKVAAEGKARSVKTPVRRRMKKNAEATLSGARQAALPERIAPQLATLVESAPDGDWRYEVKFDGYRIMARIDDGEVRLFTRNGHDWTAKMPRQAKALAKLGLASAWLDGEVVVPNEEGVPDFQALQNAFDEGGSEQMLYYLFDVPYLNGMDLREVPLEERRTALATLLEKHGGDALRFSADLQEDPDHMLASACQMKLEGLIGKRAGSAYVSRRSSSWIKIKCKNRQEFVIVGYTDPKGSRSALGALLLGLHDADSGELRYAGKVGTGFNEASLRAIHAQLEPLQAARPALANPPTGADARGAHWLKPELMCEVAFAEMTRDGVIRHSVFHGLRNDKPADAIVHEKAKPAKQVAASTSKKSAATKSKAKAKDDPQQIKITHPERVIDKSSGATKMELAQYYGRVAPWMLRDLAARPVALVRAPEGIDGELFFQKHSTKLSLPHVTQLDDPDEKQPLLLLDSAIALVSAAQMGMLEVHAWNARTPHLDAPDRLVLDLDPDPALPWKRMIEATQLVQTLLDELGLVSFLKTSGGKGMHVVVPLTRDERWDEVKDFSQAIARHMAKLLPKHFSAVSGPKNRVGKIFIDYLRNGRGATSVSAYSVRAREGLPVSVPVRRDELAALKGANQWTIRNLFERLDESGDDDPWAGIDEIEQKITSEMRSRLS
ncbi:DNA ligase D [Pseudomonas sp.]|uniref:DNA ligase D n=1 Tax=Pseudomonas sp. TaxID=306 RepID=UPI0028AE610E|nr:DNA ligase D [Pseudomonas sp.]